MAEAETFAVACELADRPAEVRDAVRVSEMESLNGPGSGGGSSEPVLISWSVSVVGRAR